MDQHLFELALLRATERLIAVMLGGVAIVLGYRLFMNVPQSTESSAEADISGKVKIILTRIGPGVFFALFGAGIVWASYYYQVTTAARQDVQTMVQADTLNPNGKLQATTQYVSYNGASEGVDTEEQAKESQRAEVRRAIRTLNQTLIKATAQERVSLRSAIETGKFALICMIWNKNWGKPNEFKAWLDERGPMPTSFQEPFTLYQLSGS